MNYDKAKELFIRYNFNKYEMDIHDVLDIYLKYQVPEELEKKWIKETLDEYIDYIEQKSSDDVQFRFGITLLFKFIDYLSLEQLQKIYNIYIKYINSYSIGNRAATNVRVFELFKESLYIEILPIMESVINDLKKLSIQDERVYKMFGDHIDRMTSEYIEKKKQLEGEHNI